MISWVKKRVHSLVHLESDSTKLALSSCLGIYIAFSPFIGLHTAMGFFFAWLFGLNIVILLTVSMTINNPWTMVPVYGAGYWFGDWLLSHITINHHLLNPQWVSICNQWLCQYISFQGFSFWAFMIGGNVIGVAFALLCYPLAKRLLETGGAASKHRVLRTVVQSRRAVRCLKAKAAPILGQVHCNIWKKCESSSSK